MSQRVTLQPAFILHTRPYKNTSLLVECFTEDFGRITVVAKGARRPSYKSRGLLQPFTSLLISWLGRSELVTLIEVEIAQSLKYLSGKSLLAAFYLNELLMRVIKPLDNHKTLFHNYRGIIAEFSEYEYSEHSLRVFEKRLLENLGYGLQLTEASDSHEPITPNESYQLLPGQGFITVTDVSQSSSLRFSGKSLLALANERMDDDSLREIKRLMRYALQPYIGDKPLNSRQMFI